MIESTQAYLIREGKWLFLLRNKKAHDVNHNKYIGVGGKREANETIRACIKREIKEETGYHANELKYHGILYFHYEKEESEKIWVYTCNEFTGEEIDCDEGSLVWVPEEDILNLDLWEGDRIFLEKLLNHNEELFCYAFHYDQNGNLIKAEEKECEDE